MIAFFFEARRAEEHHEDLAAHVERGEQGGDEADEPDRLPEPRPPMGPRRQQDVVLRPESGERRDAGDGQPPDDERHGRDGHELAEPSHAPHVLLAVQAVDHRAGTEEQERLEERVGDHVENGGDVGTGADG